METKTINIIVLFVFLLFNKAIYSEILTIDLLTQKVNGLDKKIIIFGDCHIEGLPEFHRKKSLLQSIILTNWFKTIDKKTNFIVEFPQLINIDQNTLFKMLNDDEWFNFLLVKSLIFKNSKVKLIPSDIRCLPITLSSIEDGFPKHLEMYSNGIHTDKNRAERCLNRFITLVKDGETNFNKILRELATINRCDKTLINRFSEQIEELGRRKKKLINLESRNSMFQLLQDFKNKISKWEKNVSEFQKKILRLGTNDDVVRKKADSLLKDGSKIIRVDFADLGFIISVLEALQEEDCKQIIIYVGAHHAINITYFLVKNLNIKPLYRFDLEKKLDLYKEHEKEIAEKFAKILPFISNDNLLNKKPMGKYSGLKNYYY